MTKYKVSDAGDPRKYYTQVPNYIDDLNLTVYAFRLYVHLKRVAGDDGKCWQSTDTLAKFCNMGMASVSRAKTELVYNKLIDIELVDNPNGGKDYHNITINDIWLDNTRMYSTTSHQEIATSHQEVTTSHQEVTTSPGEIKNNPLRILTEEKQRFNPPSAEQPNREDAYRERIKQAAQRGEARDIEVKQKVHDLFHLSPNWTWKGNKAFLEWAKQHKNGEMDKFAEWWYKDDWRGKTGQSPTLAQVMELWPQAFVPQKESAIDRMIREEREKESRG